MTGTRDALGQRGEAIFRVAITKFHARVGPLFNPQFLGDKWPTVDFIVELLGVTPVVPYFLARIPPFSCTITLRRSRMGLPAELVMPNAVSTAYLGQRARSLAIMHLTRRDDLNLSEQSGNEGLDLLVTILKKGRVTGRIFGVQVKARMSSKPGRDELGRSVIRMDDHAQAPTRDIPFPVALFVFTMNDDRGYYRWVREPVVTGTNGSSLRFPTGDELAELTSDELDEIVRRVDRWYDCHEASQAVA